MPFGRRRVTAEPRPGPEAVPEPAAPPVALYGSLPCNERGCTRTDAPRCDYVDRRGRSCPTAWCPDHQTIFDGHPLCRRHEGTLRAIGIDVIERELAPELDNRAPSLVNWVCTELDERVRLFLMAQVTPGITEELGEERVHLVRGGDGVRRWTRSWKLFNESGRIKVTVTVRESDDTTVILSVADQVLAEAIPPWIDRRIHNITVSDEQDREERRVFNEWLLDKICGAVIKERALRDTYHV